MNLHKLNQLVYILFVSIFGGRQFVIHQPIGVSGKDYFSHPQQSLVAFSSLCRAQEPWFSPIYSSMLIDVVLVELMSRLYVAKALLS